MRGLIAGMVSGGFVAALGLGAVSMVTPLPETPGAHLAAVLSATRAPVAMPPVVAEAPTPEPAPETTPEPAPVTVPEPTPEPAPEQMAAAEAQPEPVAPSAEVAQDPAPEAAPQEEPAPDNTVLAQLPGAKEPAPVAPVEPVAPAEPAAMPEASQTPAETVIAALPEVALPAAIPEAPPAPQPAAEPNPEPEPEVAAEPEAAPVPDKPRIFAAGEKRAVIGQKPAALGQSAGAMPQGAEPGAKPAVISGRLPQIGDKGGAGKRLEAPGAAPAAAGDTPLARNAMPFVAPERALLYSVVLIDPGVAAGGLDRATITALGFPMTIAIDPTRPDAPEAARAFRDAGLEVAILAADIPETATATDLAVIVEAWRQAVPGAIGVVDGPAAQFRQDRELVQPMVEILAREGLAVIAMEEGLNPAEHLAQAQRAGYVGLWREIDAGRERSAVVERMLSRAAFEAQRSGAVAVALSAWPETVAGLQNWEPVASRSVTLAPVSALALRSLAP